MDTPNPPKAPARSRVRVGEERAVPGGWVYDITVLRGDHGGTSHRVTLGWRDHDYWCGGATPPSRVVQAVVEYLVANRVELPPAFDAAKARYWTPCIDGELRETL